MLPSQFPPSPAHHSPRPRPLHPSSFILHPFRSAFTLIELLVVVGIMVVMMSLAIPAFNAIRGGQDLTSQSYDIAGQLEQARAYAMANNTYTLAGIMEVASTANTNATTIVTGTGIGKVVMAVVTSKDGTRPYQYLLDQAVNTPSILNNWSSSSAYATGGAFTAVGKLMTFQNIHLVDLQNPSLPLPTSGNMVRPYVQPSFDIPSAQCYSSGVFGWPLGVTYAKAQYQFTKVIEFNPQGSARIISPTNLDTIPYGIEIGLQPANGSVTAAVTGTSGNIIAIQVDGMSGATHIYRP